MEKYKKQLQTVRFLSMRSKWAIVENKEVIIEKNLEGSTWNCFVKSANP